MVVRRGSRSPNLRFKKSWIGVVRVKANLRPSGRRKTSARFSLAFLKGKRSGLPSHLRFGTETLGLKITLRSQANYGRHTPITLMRPNTESETGRVAVARLRAKRSDASPRARLRK